MIPFLEIVNRLRSLLFLTDTYIEEINIGVSGWLNTTEFQSFHEA